ncbi:hypothetical protein D3C73_1351870 [compost metagenome]
MGMRLVRVIMACRYPAQVGLTEVSPHSGHDVAHIVPQVMDSLPILRRDDDPEVVPVSAPGLNRGSSVKTVDLPVKKRGLLTGDASALSTQIRNMRG